jgi:hypothetical protein
VVTRTIGHPWLWLQQATTAFFAWGVFIGIAAAIRRNDHIYLAEITKRMTGTKRWAIETQPGRRADRGRFMVCSATRTLTIWAASAALAHSPDRLYRRRADLRRPGDAVRQQMVVMAEGLQSQGRRIL